MTSRAGRRGLALAASVLLVLAGCDSGPSGPGQLTGRALGPSLGGVVLEVEGSGIRGFSGLGSSRVYSAPVQGRSGVHRVIVIDPQPGEMRFTMEVDDRGMEGPVVTVVSAADGENRTVRSSEVTVLVER